MSLAETLTVQYDKDRNIKVFDTAGNEVPHHIISMLRLDLEEQYGLKAYLYIADDWHEDEVYKIGVSRAPYRRENEIECDMLHFIPCLERRIWKLERQLHQYFAPLKFANERFKLNHDTEYDYLAMLMTLKTERELRSWLSKATHYRPILSKTIVPDRATTFNNGVWRTPTLSMLFKSQRTE